MPVTAYTLFGQPASPAALTVDTADYTMGVQFSVTLSAVQTADLTAIWFFSAAGAGVLPDHIDVYQVSNQSSLLRQAATWSGAVASGWVRAPLTTPLALSSGTAYKGCIEKNDLAVHSFYSGTSLYWSTGAGSGGVTSGPLSAPDNAGAAQGQDTFITSTPAYPNTAFNATNYWIDVEVSVTTPAGAAVQGGGVSMARRRMMLADL